MTNLQRPGFDHLWVGEPAGLLNLWRPAQGLPVALMISPFAEEQGRCRRLQYELSNGMVAHGLHLAWLDLPGTGDSPLDETEITAPFWFASVRDALTLLAEADHKVTRIGGLRLGAAVALHAAKAVAAAPKVIAIEPISGQYALRGLLRTRIGQSEKGANELMQMMAVGATVEAAGYPLSSATKAALDHFTLDEALLAAQTIIRSSGSDMPPWLQIEPKPAEALATDLAAQLAEAVRL